MMKKDKPKDYIPTRKTILEKINQTYWHDSPSKACDDFLQIISSFNESHKADYMLRTIENSPEQLREIAVDLWHLVEANKDIIDTEDKKLVRNWKGQFFYEEKYIEFRPDSLGYALVDILYMRSPNGEEVSYKEIGIDLRARKIKGFAKLKTDTLKKKIDNALKSDTGGIFKTRKRKGWPLKNVSFGKQKLIEPVDGVGFKLNNRRKS